METSSVLLQHSWERESVSLLALSSIKGVGYWTLFKLACAGIGFNQVIRASDLEDFNNYFINVGCRAPKQPDQSWHDFQKAIWAKGNELYKQLKQMDVKVIHFDENIFPDSLRHISDPPRWLFVQGDISILHKPAITIVGTRSPSEDGIMLANYVGACLPYLDAVTVSGLATGIDQIVHKMSIRFQVPTIAVLGNGVFVNYPAGSEDLRYDICVNGGAVVTEYLPQQGYSGENFVRRNRIQAGLGNVLVPVEWKSRSGTAHTVNYASAGNKPIACLRMPDWTEKDHSELALARELGGQEYVFPIDSDAFIKDIHLKVHGKASKLVRYSRVPVAREEPIQPSENNPIKEIEQLDLDIWTDLPAQPDKQ